MSDDISTHTTLAELAEAKGIATVAASEQDKSPEPHPWLSAPEARAAARKAARVSRSLLPGLAAAAGPRDLENEACAILAECATPSRTSSTCACCGVSLAVAGARYCGPRCRARFKGVAIRDTAPSHIGSMWTWPEGQRAEYAVKTVAYCLNDWLRAGQSHAA